MRNIIIMVLVFILTFGGIFYLKTVAKNMDNPKSKIETSYSKENHVKTNIAKTNKSKKVSKKINKKVSKKVYLGEFTITAYCPCEKCCGKWSNTKNPITASGDKATEGITVGADWNILPKGTVIEIEGYGRRIVQDKPAKWISKKYNGKILDVYFSNHKDAYKFAKKHLKVYKINK